jgi:hypothetical protein
VNTRLSALEVDLVVTQLVKAVRDGSPHGTGTTRVPHEVGFIQLVARPRKTIARASKAIDEAAMDAAMLSNRRK